MESLDWISISDLPKYFSIKFPNRDTEPEGPIVGHKKGIMKILLSDNQKTLVSCSKDFTIAVWDIESKSEKAKLFGHLSEIRDIKFVNSQTCLLSASSDSTIRLWDLSTFQMIWVISVGTDSVTVISVAHNNAFFVAGSSSGPIYVCSLTTPSEIFKLEGHQDEVNTILITQKCDFIFTAADADTFEIFVWSVLTKNIVSTLSGHKNWVTCLLLIDNDQCLVSASYDSTIIFWDLLQMKELKVVHNKTNNWIKCLTCTSDYKFMMVGDFHGSVVFYDRFLQIVRIPEKKHLDAVTCLRVTKSNKFLASCSKDFFIFIWDIKKQIVHATLTGHVNFVHSIVSLSDFQFISCGDDKSIRTWNLKKQVHDCVSDNSSMKFKNVLPRFRIIQNNSFEVIIKNYNFSSHCTEQFLNYFPSCKNFAILINSDIGQYSSAFKSQIVVWNLKTNTLKFESKLKKVITKAVISKNFKYLFICDDDLRHFSIWKLN